MVYLFQWVSLAVLVYFSIVQGFYLFLTAAALPPLFRRYRQVKFERFNLFLEGRALPKVTLIVPCHNEEQSIVFNVNNLLHLPYVNKEIIVVNDGSKDHSLRLLHDYFQLIPHTMECVETTLPTQVVRGCWRSLIWPNLFVVDKAKGGKSDALNTGLNYCHTSLFLALDADTMVMEESLQTMVRSFLEVPNTVALGGAIGVANGCLFQNNRMVKIRLPKNFLSAVQVLEYLRGFLFGRVGWNSLGGNLIISGAFGLFDTQSVRACGGYCCNTVTEDLDLMIQLHRYMRGQKRPYSIRSLPDPVAWTEVPADWASLARQRERWQRGLWQVLWKHRGLFFQRRYGILGCISFPCFFIAEALSPFVELFGVVMIIVGALSNLLHLPVIFMYLGLVYGVGVLVNAFAISLEKGSFARYAGLKTFFQMVGYALVEQIGYRYATVWWRLQAFWNWCHHKQGWSRVRRLGVYGEQ